MNSSVIDKFQASQMKEKVADVRPGETVKVHYKIREGGKERIQIFEGLVIGTKAIRSYQGSFTVRKVVDGVGVERTFPLHSPHLSKVERVKSGKVRRAKLNYIRGYALSRRFKLKDKGLAGAMWEQEMPSQQSASGNQPAAEEAEPIAESRPVSSEVEGEPEAVSPEGVAETPETSQNTPDDVSEQSVRGESGELGGKPSGAPTIPDTPAEPKN